MTDLLRHRLVRRLIGIEVRDLVSATHDRLEAANVRSVEELQALPHKVVGFSAELQKRNRQLKDFLYERFYRHYRVVRMAVKAERFITDLFQAYTQDTGTLPPEIQLRASRGDPYRVVADYVAGMTDRFALDDHQKLFDPLTRP